ncbi:MAG: hypothetical protein HOP02_10535 [Methylococcaceae bacterium]|nr:hypothetical protein [Methylococcaceae bacterium]
MQALLLILALSATAFGAYATELPAGHPPINKDKMVVPSVGLTQKAKVISIINVPQYTYIEISQNNESHWLAAPTVDVKKDDRVEFDEGMIMTDFYSKTLDRTFANIAFVNHAVKSK